MSTDLQVVPPRRDRPDTSPYLWLAAAGVLFGLTAGRWTFAPAAWLAPLFLLRFIRSRRVVSGLLLAWLVRYMVAAGITLPGTVAVSGTSYFLSVLLIITVALLPYAVDRLVAPRLAGFAATLVFPTAVTTVEFLGSFGPTGTINSVANSQYGDLPLMQLVSVTGIWGITFLVAWFAAVVNWAWEQGFAWPRVGRGTAVYAAVLVVVFGAGAARLVFTSPGHGVVRVAAVSASRHAVQATGSLLRPATVHALESGTATPVERAAARAAFTTLDDDLLAGSRAQAEAGAKIVAWPEASTVGASVLQQDEPALLQRAAALARQQRIYLEVGLGVFLPGPARPPYLRDESVLIGPTGHVAWTYEKTHLVPFSEQGLIVPGNGRLPIADTAYGRLAGAICFDQDFPATMRQAGQSGADLLIGPSNDWRAIDPTHAHAAAFRAIENGYSLLRPASNGLSIAVDPRGHVIGSADYFTTTHQVLIADLPTHGAPTIYSRIGDLFAWLCLLGIIALVIIAIRRPRPGTATSHEQGTATTVA